MEVFETIEGCLDSSLVIVETEIEPLGQAFDEVNMFLGQGSTTDPDSVGDPRLMKGYCVHLSLDHDNRVLFRDFLLGKVESVEDRTFIKDIRSRGVEVLRLSLVDDTTRKCNCITREVRNREDDTSEEFISSWCNKYPGIDDILFGEILLFETSEKFSRIPRIPELKPTNGILRYPSASKVLKLRFILRKPDRFMIKFRRDAIHIVDIARFFSAFLIIISFELHSSLFCEYLECLAILDFFDLHEKFDRSTPMMTPETVGDIFGGGDDK